MRPLRTRYDLLHARLDRFQSAMAGVEDRNVEAVHKTRVASRRLRELLPVLQLPSATAAGLVHQLRKVTRQLGGVRESDVTLLLIDELHESGRFHEPALERVQDAVRRTRDDARRKLPAKTASAGLRRIARKLDRVAKGLEAAEDPQTARAWRWALDARVSRRALALSEAMDEAGALYLPDRVHRVRIALKKLRYGLELVVEAGGVRRTPELTTLKRTQALLGRLHDLQVLVDRVRQVQGAATPPAVAAWRDLGSLVVTLEQMCRRLHARYVGERAALHEICDRYRRLPAGRRAPGESRRAGGHR